MSASPTSTPPPALHRFSHRAMACLFEVIIPGHEARYARQAADTAFAEVDRLELELSRFNPASDIARINAAAAGEWVRIGPETLECLELARQVYEDTGGAFDVTVGAAVDRETRGDSQRSPGAGEEPEPVIGMAALEISRPYKAVGLRRAGACVDLGAIGKGYAVDQAVAILRDWGIVSALVHSGQSTAYALGAPQGQSAWTLAIRDPREQEQLLGSVLLCDQAFSGSGVSLHGRHIIDPRTGRGITDRLGAWAITPASVGVSVGGGGAALSDAISTAFMVMTMEQIAAYCDRHPQITAMVLPPEDSTGALPGAGKLRYFGAALRAP